MFFPAWFTIGLTSVFIGVFGSFLDKYLLKKYFDDDDESDGDGAGGLILFSAFFLCLITPFLYYVSSPSLTLDSISNQLGILSGFLSCIWILLYLHALSRTDVSQAIPLFQTIPFFGLILAFIFFGEWLTSIQFISATVMLLGATILLYIRDSTGSIDTKGSSVTLLLMLGSSFLVALSQVVFKAASNNEIFLTILFWNWIGFIGCGLVLFLVVSSYRQEFFHLIIRKSSSLKNMFGAGALNESFDVVSDLLLLAAVLFGPVALVQSINAYEPFLTLLISFVIATVFSNYFESDVSKGGFTQKIVGVAVITIGSVMLYTTF